MTLSQLLERFIRFSLHTPTVGLWCHRAPKPVCELKITEFFFNNYELNEMSLGEFYLIFVD